MTEGRSGRKIRKEDQETVAGSKKDHVYLGCCGLGGAVTKDRFKMGREPPPQRDFEPHDPQRCSSISVVGVAGGALAPADFAGFAETLSLTQY
jgi:hypothetical protein